LSDLVNGGTFGRSGAVSADRCGERPPHEPPTSDRQRGSARMDETAEEVYEHNQVVFTDLYAGFDPDEIADHVRRAPEHLAESRRVWVGAEVMWHGDLIDRLQGAKVLEIGCGTGENALMMLAMGAAHVTANEINDTTAALLSKAASELGMTDRLDIAIGDILELDLGATGSFDVVVAKEVLHHIPADIEDAFVARMADLVADDGFVRIYDPCVNWKTLDQVRWALPMPGRPSMLQREKFAEWKASDPHPDRDNSTQHVVELFARHFDDVESMVAGGLARFHRMAPESKHLEVSAWLQQRERALPNGLHERIAAVHAITATRPRRP
jgi:2-polyprenyl-3-methyl-5-hydroxy-6-metoxy-1,4-benzoquinol methylase